MQANHHPMLDEHQLAAELCLSVKTLRKWRWAGEGPKFVKLGRAVRHEREAVEAFNAAGRRASTSADAA